MVKRLSDSKNIRLGGELRRKIKALAKADGRTESDWIRRALEAAVKGGGK